MTLEETCEAMAKRYGLKWQLSEERKKIGLDRVEMHIHLIVDTRLGIRYRSPQVKQTNQGILKFWLCGLIQAEEKQLKSDRIMRREELF